MTYLVQLEVNGVVHELHVDPDRSLLSVLREGLGLTGTKEGCDDSESLIVECAKWSALDVFSWTLLVVDN